MGSVSACPLVGPEPWVVFQFEAEAVLRRHLAKQTRRYEFKLRSYRALVEPTAIAH
jgi:hypothetical protein